MHHVNSVPKRKSSGFKVGYNFHLIPPLLTQYRDQVRKVTALIELNVGRDLKGNTNKPLQVC